MSADSDMGTIFRVSTANVIDWCTREEAIKEMTDPAYGKDNLDLVWIPDEEGKLVVSGEELA